MRRRMVFAVVAVISALWLGGGGIASAQSSRHRDPFMEDPKTSVYATNAHMGFSLRVTLIRWLGGIPLVRHQELERSEHEGWWGNPVPQLPSDVLMQGELR